MDSEREKRMMQYLLGQLPDQEQAELEDRFVSDDKCFEELLILEEDLRDAYARGELSAPDRKAFEQRLLTAPQQREKQEFAQALMRYQQPADSAAQRTQRKPLWKSMLRFLRARPILVPVLSVGLLVLIAAGLWLSHRSVQSLAPIETASRSAQGAGKGPLAGKPPKAVDQKIATLALTGSLVRGAGHALPTLVIPADVGRVRLEVPIQANYPRYETTLQTVEGKILSRNANLQPQSSAAAKEIVVLLPSSLLPAGDYILTLRGLPLHAPSETVGEYSFRIGKR